jgi:hypothetical protein
VSLKDGLTMTRSALTSSLICTGVRPRISPSVEVDAVLVEHDARALEAKALDFGADIAL